jgi:hypothetical protein
MKAQIVDPEALRAISPAALASYVRAEGWVRAEKYGDHSDVYQRADAGEVILPGTTALRDYAAVVAEIIDVLAKREARDQLQVYRDLVGADRDVVRVRAPHAEDDGSIPVEAGVEIITHARDLLLSAACAAHQPRPAFRAGRVKEASHYMERVRLGQTEHGSFIVTMLAPVPPTLVASVQTSLWPDHEDEPFERLVTRRLADALVAARGAAEHAIRGDGFDAFEDSIAVGISANLCEALSTLIEHGDGLDVSIAWAKTRPTPEPRRKVEFSRADGEIFGEAARLFRSREPRPDERLEAFVVKLDRGELQSVGRATLRAFVDGQSVSVRADLPEPLYSTAVQAHEGRRTLNITGDLRRQGQRWHLDNPREVGVANEETE